VVEKAIVVGGVLEGEDGSVDEGVEPGNILYKRFRKIEIHVCGCKGSDAVSAGGMGLGLEGDWNVTESISQDPRDMKMHSLATGFPASTWQIESQKQ